MGRITIMLALVSLPWRLLAEDPAAFLPQFEGRWTGAFTIHSTAAGYTEKFPVEQRYWMVGDRLRGISVVQREESLETSTSWTSIDAKKLVSSVKRGASEERFYGALKEGAVLWISSDLARAEDYQMTQRFVVEGGERKLITEGFNTYLYAEGLAYIVYRGELTWQEPVSPDWD